MKEIGFWDYTCPGHGSVERYTTSEWDVLLDDMAAAGWNSLVLCPKWMTTGYRSRYPWLDQDPTIASIQTDNATIHHALRGARKRGMRTWILVVASIFDIKSFGFAPQSAAGGWEGTAPYDLEQAGVAERIELLFEEITQLFGAEADGFIIELEHCDAEAPHRVPLYDAWAKANGRPDFATIKNITLQPRSYPFWHWRDFTTSRRIEMYRRVEKVLRSNRFNGTITTIAEMDNGPTFVCGNVNLAMLKEAFPTWPLVTYDSIYDRRVNRLATMDFCVEQPRELGMEALWITRGVMTFTWPPDGPSMDLQEQWRLSLEDAARHQPAAVWFMGSDARHEGLVVSPTKLPKWGFADGRTARKKLMQMSKEMGIIPSPSGRGLG